MAGLVLCVAVVLGSPRQAKADTLPVVYETGTLTGNEIWSAGQVYVVSTYVVSSGATLTIQAGAIVKYQPSWSNVGIIVSEGGTLNVNGTASQPVLFTSINDDSLGGDSANDGPSTPTSGEYKYAILTRGAATINHATFAYSAKSIQANCGTTDSTTVALTVANNAFNGGGIAVDSCLASKVILQNNTFQASYGNALEVSGGSDISGISLSGSTKNTFTGSGKALAMMLYNAVIPSGSALAVSSDSGVVFGLQFLTINGMLNVGQGVVFKTLTGVPANGIIVTESGSLAVSGSSTAPVVFTSIKDDTLGGDTGGDGPTAPAPGDYSWVLAVRGVATIDQTRFMYNSKSVQINCGSPSSMAVSAVITNSEFDSAGVRMDGCVASRPILQSNTFSVVVGNAIESSSSDISGIVLSGSAKNTFNGSDKSRVISLLDSQVSQNPGMTIDSGSNAVLVVQDLYVYGYLTINPGVVLKTVASQSSKGLVVATNGRLDINGSQTVPVTFTSINDDSAGGDSAGDGPTIPTTDYPVAISMQPDSTANVSHTNIQYAGRAFSVGGGQLSVNTSRIMYVGFGFDAPFQGLIDIRDSSISQAQTGINVSGTAKAIFRGTINNVIGYYIQACNWQSSGCAVDAAYNDWGSANGPLVTPGSDRVCGAVTISPWIVGSSTGSAGIYRVENCDGSPNPAEQMRTNYTNFHRDLRQRTIDCSAGYQDACDVARTTLRCLNAAVKLAGSQAPFPVTFDDATDAVDTVAQTTANAANTVVQSVEEGSPFAFKMNFYTNLLGVLGLTTSIGSAYATCHP
ncbi:MAG TPA: hypothetical protein VIR03_01760 [Candidatus Saccharimonadales bacterium]